jgi:hypothetical protein
MGHILYDSASVAAKIRHSEELFVVRVFALWAHNCVLYIYRPFAFPQEGKFLKNVYFLPIRTLSVTILKLFFVVRLLVRCVTD